MKNIILPGPLSLPLTTYVFGMSSTETLSADYLKAIKSEGPVEKIRQALSELSIKDLEQDLKSDLEKKAFWLNLYNAEVQYSLKMNPDHYQDRNEFFSKELFKFKDHSLSLDDVEHGILRKSQTRILWKYVPKLIVSSTEKKLRVEKVDWRIHFALNCGAESCPAIYFYQSEKLEAQLETAAMAFLSQDVDFNPEKNVLKVSKLFSWFNNDFGGEKDIKKIIQKYLNLPLKDSTSIKYKDYDWKLNLKNFQ